VQRREVAKVIELEVLKRTMMMMIDLKVKKEKATRT
jgi:hypothetical protein